MGVTPPPLACCFTLRCTQGQEKTVRATPGGTLTQRCYFEAILYAVICFINFYFYAFVLLISDAIFVCGMRYQFVSGISETHV